MSIASRICISSIEQGWLWTFHNLYLTISDEIITQTDDPRDISLMAIFFNNSIALLNCNSNQYIVSIASDGSFTESVAIHFFSAVPVPGAHNVFMIKNANLQLSARSASERLAVRFVENKNKWEQFTLIPTSRNEITPVSSDLLVAIEKYSQTINNLEERINKLQNDISYIKNRTDSPIDFVPRLSQWYKNTIYASENFDIFNPKTFNDKIQYLKIFGNLPLMMRLSDKILVRDYLIAKGYSDTLVPLFGVYTTPSEINYDLLPDSFVIKCNHGCGMNIVISSKKDIDKDQINKKLTKWLSINYAYTTYELQYRDIVPRILIEQNISMDGTMPRDYKIFCFNGEPEIIAVVLDRGLKTTRAAVFDTSWKKLNTSWHFPLYEGEAVPRPENFDRMLEMARVLSAEFPHVRVDLYHTDEGKIFFGEMTFTSCSGLNHWSDKGMDAYLGNLIKLDIHRSF